MCFKNRLLPGRHTPSECDSTSNLAYGLARQQCFCRMLQFHCLYFHEPRFGGVTRKLVNNGNVRTITVTIMGVHGKEGSFLEKDESNMLLITA